MPYIAAFLLCLTLLATAAPAAPPEKLREHAVAYFGPKAFRLGGSCVDKLFPADSRL